MYFLFSFCGPSAMPLLLLSDLLDKKLHIKIEDTSRQLYPTIKQFPVIYATVISCKIRDNEPRLDSICKKVHCQFLVKPLLNK